MSNCASDRKSELKDFALEGKARFASGRWTIICSVFIMLQRRFIEAERTKFMMKLTAAAAYEA